MQDQTKSLATANDFPAMLQRFKGEIARALPKHLDPDRMARIALTCFRQTPALGRCDPKSVFAAVIMASQCGLEPGLMGQAYLVPYKSECQFIPGYQGLIELVRRSGKVKRIEAHVVYEKDTFKYTTGLTTTLVHEPCLDGNPGVARLAYSVAEFVDGGYHVEVMTRVQIETIRNRSAGYRSGRDSPWTTDPDEMWRKTVIRRICKYLPKTAELALALSLDDAATTRTGQRIDLTDAIEGTWSAPEVIDVVDEDEKTASQKAADKVKDALKSKSAPVTPPPVVKPDEKPMVAPSDDMWAPGRE